MRRPSYATIVAHVALVVALSTGATAAVLVTGNNVKDGSLTGADVKDGSLTRVDLKAGALTAGNLKPGTLTGAQVKKHSIPVDRLSGKVPVDTTNLYDKAQSDARFLAVGATAANALTAGNANQLGGLAASSYSKGKATSYSGTATATVSPNATGIEILDLPGLADVIVLNCTAGVVNFQMSNLAPDYGGLLYYETPTTSSGFTGNGWLSIGSASTAGTWSRYTIVQGAGPSAKIAKLEVRSGITGTTCSYEATATVYG